MIIEILPENTKEEIAGMINKNKIIVILRKKEKYVYGEGIGYQTGYHSGGGHESGMPWEWTYHHMHLREYNTAKSFWDMPDDTAKPSELFRFNEDDTFSARISIWNTYLRDDKHWFLQDYSDYISEECGSKANVCSYLKKQISNENTIGIYIADGNSIRDISMTAKKLITNYLLNNEDCYAETFGLED